MRPNPLTDAIAFLSKPDWPTPIFWILLVGSAAIAIAVWRREPAQRSGRHVGIWLLRAIVGTMWWQQSLWKIPPNYDGLIYWMQQMTEHASIELQGSLVARYVIPNIAVFGPLLYLIEVAIGISLLLGLLSRIGAFVGALMAINLWLGLYSAPNEWPWTYFFLIVIQILFVIDPPGRSLGADVLVGGRLKQAAGLRALAGFS
jgi:uncharacterized membrane protein YphA (DoxX/SURF4 family)